MDKNEIKIIESLNDYDFVKYFVNGLISRSTGGKFDLYQNARNKLLQKDFSQIPTWVKTCRDDSQFWQFIKNKYSTYAERRSFIWSEFESLLNDLESSNSSPLIAIVFDELHIHSLWQKALDRKVNDPEGAITIARTLIESTLKHIMSELALPYNDNMDLSELYKEVAKALKLAPEQHQEQIFKQILGGANGIINGLGTLRNKLGDAHGSDKFKVKPKERHSELAINMAGSMAMFLFKTFKETKG